MSDTKDDQGQPEQTPASIDVPKVQVLEVRAQAQSVEESRLPGPTPDNLQDLLPEIHQLAQRVGGYGKLAEIVEMLRGMQK